MHDRILDGSRPAKEWRLGDEGEAQSADLARRLEPFVPFALLSSAEPKARRTAEIVGGTLDIEVREEAGFGELDRAVLPIVSREELDRLNRPVFEDDVDASSLWKQLTCASYVVLARPDFQLQEVVAEPSS